MICLLEQENRCHYKKGMSALPSSVAAQLASLTLGYKDDPFLDIFIDFADAVSQMLQCLEVGKDYDEKLINKGIAKIAQTKQLFLAGMTLPHLEHVHRNLKLSTQALQPMLTQLREKHIPFQVLSCMQDMSNLNDDVLYDS